MLVGQILHSFVYICVYRCRTENDFLGRNRPININNLPLSMITFYF